MKPNVLNVATGPSANVGLTFSTNTANNQYYKAPRPGNREHSGVDIQMSPNSKQITYLGGKIIHIGRDPGGYDTYIDILTPTGKIERLAELGILDKRVKKGATLLPGQIVSHGWGRTGVTHLEYRNPNTSGISGTVDPLKYLRSLGVISGGDNFTYVGLPNNQKKQNISSDKLKPNPQSLTPSIQSTLKNPRAEQINQRITQAKTGEKFDVIHQGVRYTIKKGVSGTEVYGPDGKVSNESFSRAVRNNEPVRPTSKPSQISSIPKPLNIPQQIAKWDTAVIPIQERVIATRIVEKQVPIPVAAKSTPAIFPEERASVNTDRQREVMAVG